MDSFLVARRADCIRHADGWSYVHGRGHVGMDRMMRRTLRRFAWVIAAVIVWRVVSDQLARKDGQAGEEFGSEWIRDGIGDSDQGSRVREPASDAVPVPVSEPEPEPEPVLSSDDAEAAVGINTGPAVDELPILEVVVDEPEDAPANAPELVVTSGTEATEDEPVVDEVGETDEAPEAPDTVTDEQPTLTLVPELIDEASANAEPAGGRSLAAAMASATARSTPIAVDDPEALSEPVEEAGEPITSLLDEPEAHPQTTEDDANVTIVEPASSTPAALSAAREATIATAPIVAPEPPRRRTGRWLTALLLLIAVGGVVGTIWAVLNPLDELAWLPALGGVITTLMAWLGLMRLGRKRSDKAFQSDEDEEARVSEEMLKRLSS